MKEKPPLEGMAMVRVIEVLRTEGGGEGREGVRAVSPPPSIRFP